MGTIKYYFIKKLIKSKSVDEDIARKEFIFSILLIGIIVLTFVAMSVSLIRCLTKTNTSENVSPLFLILSFILFIGLFLWLRKGYSRYNAIIFLCLMHSLGTYALFRYGYAMPQGLLMYAIVIIISAILISTFASFLSILASIIILVIITYLQEQRIVIPYVDELNDPLKVGDLTVYVALFAVILTVAWLYKREIENSLSRARNSEYLLKKERDLLEIKVHERTKELESAQIEKTMELYKFAELGKHNISLLHDLANPLTSVSLHFSSLKSGYDTETYAYMQESINHLEKYVESARLQIRNQDIKKNFMYKLEITKATNVLNGYSKSNSVKIITNLDKNHKIYGNNIKFNQIMTNLIKNAIDSYKDLPASKNNKVFIVSNISSSSLTISVTDKGIGIPYKIISKIFDPFYTTKPHNQGSGIGLTIVREMIEKDFRGKIKVNSNKINGTSFTLTIPIKG